MKNLYPLFKVSADTSAAVLALFALSPLLPVTARKDDVSAAVQAATVNVAGKGSISGGGGLIQTTSGWRQHLVDRDQRRGFR